MNPEETTAEHPAAPEAPVTETPAPEAPVDAPEAPAEEEKAETGEI